MSGIRPEAEIGGDMASPRASHLGYGLWRAVLGQRPKAAYLLAFWILYVLAAGYAQLLAIIPETGISIWPPSGLFLATLISSTWRTWPWWILTAFLAELFANLLWFHNALPVAVLINTGNALEAVIGAWLVRRVCRRPVRLEALGGVLALVALGAGLAPMVSATVGSATLALFGVQTFSRAWPLWWIGDATGVLIFAPLALVVLQSWRQRARLTRGRLLEGAVLGTILLAIGTLALSGFLPFAYIIMPALLWAAVRFEFKGAAITLLLLALMTAAFTITGLSPFSGDQQSQEQKHVMLQLFLAISALSSLIVAAMSRQHQQALLILERANNELESRVTQRTASLRESERRLAAVLEALPIGVALADATGRTLVSNEVFRQYVPAWLPSKDDQRQGLWEASGGNGRRIEPFDWPDARALRGERIWPGQEFLFHGSPDRGPVWTRVAAIPFRDDQGAVIGATAVIDDIDQEKRARDAVRASEARMRMMQEGAGVGTWEWNLASKEVFWSDQTFSLFGLDPEKHRASYDTWWGVIHPGDQEQVSAAVAEAVGKRTDLDIEYRVALEDGGVRWIVGRGRVLSDASGKPEWMMGINFDITARKLAEEQQLLLAREVDHRAKNALAVVQSLVRLTRTDDPAAYARTLEGRIAALARAHTLLARERWAGGDLRALLEEELAAYVSTGQVALEGAAVTLKADAVQPLAMSMHELTTNAAKYGALSLPGGRVAIDWRLDDAFLQLTWVEAGGPPVAAPDRTGFGARLLDAAVRGQLGGGVVSSWRPSGLHCELKIAADRVQAARRNEQPAITAAMASASQAGSPAPRNGLKVLIGEDEVLVAMDLANRLRELGCTVVALAETLQGLRLHEENAAGRIDLAVLDINLAGQPSFPVAQSLLRQGVPVIFATGYGDLPGERWAADERVILLRKPVASADLAKALAALCPKEAAKATGRRQ